MTPDDINAMEKALAKIEEGVALLRVIRGYEIDAHDIEEILNPLWRDVKETEKDKAA